MAPAPSAGPSPGTLRRLELTRRRPAAYRRACAGLRAAVGADLCPALVPAGELVVESARPLRGYPRTFGIDMASRALTRLDGRRVPAAGGHWTVEATASEKGRRLFRRQDDPASARRRSGCRVDTVAGRPVRVCRVAGYRQGGGYYAGHVTAEWVAGGFAVQVTAHGYANRPRVLALLASVVARHAVPRRPPSR